MKQNVVRYSSEGRRIQVFGINTIPHHPTFMKWYNDVSIQGLVQKLNTGHTQPLPDGGWLELEKKD
jgi:hypothetical protein